MEQLADEPLVHRDNLGRFAVKPALSDEKRYANRLLVAYVESLVALSGRGGLSLQENELVTGTPASLAEALGAVLTTRPAEVAETATSEALSAPFLAHWLLWAAGVASLLAAVPATAR